MAFWACGLFGLASFLLFTDFALLMNLCKKFFLSVIPSRQDFDLIQDDFKDFFVESAAL